MKYQLPNLLNVVNGLAKNRGITLRSICISMNRQHNFLNSHLRTNNPRIDVLLELSDLLNVNLLEAYLHAAATQSAPHSPRARPHTPTGRAHCRTRNRKSRTRQALGRGGEEDGVK
jgi:hypothetical protein